MKGTTRYFFATFPEILERDAIIERANAIQATLGLTGNRVLKSKINLTLAFVGAFEGEHDAIEQQALAAGNSIVATGPHDIRFDRMVRFVGEYGKNRDFQPAMFYPSAVSTRLQTIIDRLRERLAQTCGRGGELPPHVTWIYTDADQADQAVPVEPMTWQAETICLVKSVQGAGEYEIVRKWAL